MAGSILPHHHDDHLTNEQIAELLRETLEKTDNFQIVSDVFKQLADSSRVRIFWLLCHCEECVINISALVDMSSPAVSHHLKQLKSSNLIVSRRLGKEVYYKASDSEAAQVLHKTIEHMMEITCPEN